MLRDRLLEALPNADELVAEGGFDMGPGRSKASELAGWLAEHTAGGRTGVDVVGHWGSGRGDVVALSLTAADGTAAYLDVTQLLPADEQALAGWLADPARPKAMHDAKGPLLAVYGPAPGTWPA